MYYDKFSCPNNCDTSNFLIPDTHLKFVIGKANTKNFGTRNFVDVSTLQIPLKKKKNTFNQRMIRHIRFITVPIKHNYMLIFIENFYYFIFLISYTKIHTCMKLNS